MMVAQVVFAPVFLLSCFCYGLAAAMLPTAVVAALIEQHRPARVWRVAGWTVVGVAFLTPAAFGLAAILTQ